MNLVNQAALVTGASKGIGATVARVLGKYGAAVSVNYGGDRQGAEEVVQTIRDEGGQAEAIQADVSRTEEVKRMVDHVIDKWGRLDILVNNAGINRDNLLVRMSDEDWQRVLDVNLNGAFNCTRAVLRFMMKQRHGRIVNVSSVIGLTGNAGQANYAATKAGLIGLTKSTAQEVASRGIAVNAVAPGFIATEMTGELSSEIQEQYLSRIPMGCPGQTVDVAELVAFLASPAAAYITGEVVRVDGGLAM